jgi:serine/threonine protein phosphatase PrpC
MSSLPAVSRKPRDDEMDVFACSHTGNVRKENQDHFLLAAFHRRTHVISTNLPDAAVRLPQEEQRLVYLAMIADGVGGGQGGSEASATALEAAMQYVHDAVNVYYGAKDDEDQFASYLEAAALRAHDAVLAKRAQMEARRTMATTLTLFMGVWPIYYLLQVGDSRYYLWREGKLTQVTRDQTMAEDLVAQGVLTRAAAARSPMAHVLSSAIGSESTMPVVTRLAADWHNVHLMCTDGLTKHVTDERIAEILGSMTSSKQACEQLLQEALDGGGTDNITIIVGRSVPKAQ